MAVLKKVAEKDEPKQGEQQSRQSASSAGDAALSRPIAPQAPAWQPATAEDLKPAPVITERQERPSIPQVNAEDPILLKYDVLRFPIGRMDFDNAKRMFRDLRGATDQKNLAQFVALLQDGYEIAPGGFVPADGYAYFLFVKKS